MVDDNISDLTGTIGTKWWVKDINSVEPSPATIVDIKNEEAIAIVKWDYGTTTESSVPIYNMEESIEKTGNRTRTRTKPKRYTEDLPAVKKQKTKTKKYNHNKKDNINSNINPIDDCPLVVIKPSTATATATDGNNVNINGDGNTNDNDIYVINLLHDLNDILQRNDNDENNIQRKLKEWCRLRNKVDDRGVRFINGDRYEIFVKAADKPILAFEYLCQEILKKYEKENDNNNNNNNTKYYYNTVDEMKYAIIKYASRQAKHDKRITNDYIFDNFSMIVTYGKVKRQCPHIDMRSPNYQFGLIITDNTLPTIVYQKAITKVTKDNVEAFLRSIYNDIPDELIELIKKDDTAALSYLRKYGSVLSNYPPYPQTDCSTGNKDSDSLLLETGSVMCLPGGYVHAGPPSKKFRAILFFSAHPSNNNNNNNNNNIDDDDDDDQPYYPDQQYNAPFLCCDIACELWGKCDHANQKYLRKYLLINMIQKAIKDTGNESVYRYFSENSKLQKIVQMMCKRNSISKPFLDSILSAPDLGVDDTICGKPLSVPNLINKNTKNPMIIYEYKKDKNRIIFFYPNQGRYEGIDDHYTLQMNDNNDNEALYNGTNGKIFKYTPEQVFNDQFIIQSDTSTMDDDDSNNSNDDNNLQGDVCLPKQQLYDDDAASKRKLLLSDSSSSSSSNYGAQHLEPLKESLPSATTINNKLLEESSLSSLSPIDILWWFKCYGYKDVDSMHPVYFNRVRYIIDYQCLFLNKHVENLPNDQKKFYEYIRTNVHEELAKIYGNSILISANNLCVFFRSEHCNHESLPKKENIGTSLLETDKYKLRGKNELETSYNYFQKVYEF